jgi:hypothetical protein
MAATGHHLLQLLILVISGWLQREQAEVIEYLKAENRMLRQKLGGRRILFTDAERRLLARRAHAIGRKALAELNPIVTPDTLLRWHRELVAGKWNFIERRRPGRPRTRAEIEALVVRMATDNPGWGYTRLMLRRALREYGAHFHHDRNHQGLGNVLIMPRSVGNRTDGPVMRRPRLGGLLNFYERTAA